MIKVLQATIKISIFLASWLSVFFLPNKKKLFVKYLPVSLFSTMLLILEIFYFTVNKLWYVKGPKKNLFQTAMLLVFGPYLISNIWFFHLSKGKFLPYSIINLVADLIYAYPIIALLKKLHVFKIKVKSSYFFILIFTDALLNYSFHKFFNKIQPQIKR